MEQGGAPQGKAFTTTEGSPVPPRALCLLEPTSPELLAWGSFLVPGQAKGLHVRAQGSCLAWDRARFRVETRRTWGLRREAEDSLEAALSPLVAHLSRLLPMASSNLRCLGVRGRCADCPRPTRARITKSHSPLSTRTSAEKLQGGFLEPPHSGQVVCPSGPGPSQLAFQGTGSLYLPSSAPGGWEANGAS